MKPTIFIGSSTEGLKTAYAIQENLEHDVLCKVWTQGVFLLSGNALENLLDAAHDSDFAIFVFQPDDISQIRDRIVSTVRDNVVFELGMFIAALGKQRVFFLVPKGSEKIHLPTDLIGVEPGYYVPPNRDEELLAALGPFCNRVRRQSARCGEKKVVSTRKDGVLLKVMRKGLMSLTENKLERVKKRKTWNLGFRWMRLATTRFQ